MKPPYWDRARRDLARRDPVLAGIIRRHRGEHLVSRDDPFATLARAIVGQQISVRAAQSVWNRVLDAAPGMTPKMILTLEQDALRRCGLSLRKTEYLADLARHFSRGTLRPSQWASMGDDAVIADLVAVRGIGRWTAEMFLIFNLLRPDVLPLDDVGLLNAVRLAYFGRRKVPAARIHKLATGWAPWRSVATWYLWRSLDPLPVEY